MSYSSHNHHRSHKKHGRHRYHHRFEKTDMVILFAVLGLILFLVLSNQRFKVNYAKGGQEDDIVLVSTTTEATLPPAEANKAILDLPFNYVAYSKISGYVYRINTAEQYRWNAQKGFNSIEGDVRITHDGKLVMNWYEGVTLNKKGKIVSYNPLDAVYIRDMTEDECLNLRHDGRNSPMCSFDEYVKICKKYDKIAFITLWNESLEEVIPEMIRILKKYDMVEQCIVNSYDFAVLKEIRKVEPIIVLSKLTKNNTNPTKEAIDKAAEMGNCIVCGSSLFQIKKVKDMEEMIDLEILDYAKAKNVPLYETQVGSNAIANKLKQYGYAGVQMTVVTNFE